MMHDAFIGSIPIHGNRVTEDDIRKKVFPMCLQDMAKTWLLNLPERSLATWEEVNKAVLGKYFPYAKTSKLRTQIAQFQQKHDETFSEARERFKGLLVQCPHHKFDGLTLCQYFYEGLNQNEQMLVDMSLGGSIIRSTAEEIEQTFERLAIASQHRGVKSKEKVARGEARMVDMEATLANDEAIVEMQKFKVPSSVGKDSSQSEVCDICYNFGHGANMCRLRES